MATDERIVAMTGANFMARVRVNEDTWAAALERAEGEGTKISALVRDWLAHYVAEGSPVPGGRRPPIRLNAAEFKAAAEATGEQLRGVVDSIVAAVNKERG